MCEPALGPKYIPYLHALSGRERKDRLWEAVPGSE